MSSWLVAFVVLAGCSGDHDAPRAVAPPPAPPPECRTAIDCELQSRCYWSQPAECVPHAEWREVLCTDSDPPDPSRKLESCDCVAEHCAVK